MSQLKSRRKRPLEKQSCLLPLSQSIATTTTAFANSCVTLRSLDSVLHTPPQSIPLPLIFLIMSLNATQTRPASHPLAPALSLQRAETSSRPLPSPITTKLRATHPQLQRLTTCALQAWSLRPLSRPRPTSSPSLDLHRARAPLALR